MLRRVITLFFATATPPGLTGIIAQVSPDDPTAGFLSLGVTGLICGVLWLWRVQETKRADRFEAALQAQQQTQATSVEVTRQVTEVMGKVLDFLQELPKKDTWTDILGELRRIQSPPRR